MGRKGASQPLGAAPRMNFHPEILTPKQKEVLQELGPWASEQRGFRLAGGTALAIYFGHRRSEDFDWFTEESIEDAHQLARDIEDHGFEWSTEQVSRGTLHGHIQGIRVTFLEFRYPLLREPMRWEDFQTALLSVDDIACMKLSAIAQRGARKDFVDLYALLEAYRDLPELLDLYGKKFNVEDIGHVLYSLSYFEDAEQEPMPEMLWDVQWNHLKAHLQERVESLTD